MKNTKLEKLKNKKRLFEMVDLPSSIGFGAVTGSLFALLFAFLGLPTFIPIGSIFLGAMAGLPINNYFQRKLALTNKEIDKIEEIKDKDVNAFELETTIDIKRKKLLLKEIDLGSRINRIKDIKKEVKAEKRLIKELVKKYDKLNEVTLKEVETREEVKDFKNNI